MRFFLVALLLLLALPLRAEESACFTPRQVAAEQLLRLQSELMVIGLSCRQTSQGHQLIPIYQKFSKRFSSSIRDAESELSTYFENQGQNPESKLDKFRTEVANTFAQQVASDTLPIYCRQQQLRLLEAAQWTPARIRKELGFMATRYGTMQPSCEPLGASSWTNPIHRGAQAFPVQR